MRTGRTIVMAAALAAAPAAMAQQPGTSAAPVAEGAAAMAEARAIVARLLPPGTYRKLMGATMGPMVDTMTDSIGALPLRQLAQLGGLDAKQAAMLDKVDLQRIMALYDPHWQERSRLTMRAMIDGMGAFFETMEPELRIAYARAFAHQFTPAELKDINRYLATPTGAKFATRYMSLATDPAILDVSKSMMPKMMAEMPRLVEAAQKASAALPPPRRIADLSAAERAELAKALGVPEGKLSDPGGQR